MSGRRTDEQRLAAILGDGGGQGRTRPGGGSAATDQIRQEMRSAMHDLLLAADAAKLTSTDPYRMMARMHATIMGSATEALCGLLDETRRVSNEAAAARKAEQARRQTMIDARRRYATLRLGVATLIILAAIGSGTAYVTIDGRMTGRSIDLAGPSAAECAATTDKSSGEYRCSVNMLLLFRRK